MKIALIAPPYPLQEAPSPPLGISYVAAVCEKAGIEVKILDYIVSLYTKEKLFDELNSFCPDIVGATSVTMTFPFAASIIRDVKLFNPSIITLMGGPHVSFDTQRTLLEYPEIDIVVTGEAEETIMELMPVITDRKGWGDIPGIAFMKDGQVLNTGRRELIEDLDSIPIPSRHLLPMSRYQALGFPVSIITSRGCPNRCIFCLGRRMVGFKVRYRDPSLVIDEIEDVLSYGFTRINIADDIFTANKKRVYRLCDEILSRGIEFSWSAFARVNTVDTPLLKAMKEAGCDSVSFGIESGNKEMLKRVKKGITIDQAKKAIQSCKEAGIIAHASFIAGLPGETWKTLNDSENLAKELDIAYGYHLLAPFPGTTVCEDIDNYDLEIQTQDWSQYDANRAVVKTSGLSQDNLEEFVTSVEEGQKKKWKAVEERYKRGECSGDEALRVEGFARMGLIYSLLSEDLIEKLGSTGLVEDPFSHLSEQIAKTTHADMEFVRTTLKDLMNSGYIKQSTIQGQPRFLWTHNNRMDKI